MLKIYITSSTSLDTDNAAVRSFITKERLERATRMSSIQEAKNMLAVELLLCLHMKRQGHSTFPLSIYHTETGKPMLLGDELFFSFSHSAGIAACAVSDVPVGLDVELLCKRTDAMVDSFFAAGGNTVTGTLAWTAIEAYAKFTGEGLSSLRHLENIFVENDKVLDKNNGGVCPVWLHMDYGFAMAVCGAVSKTPMVESIECDSILKELNIK